MLESQSDYVSEEDLRDLGIDPVVVRIICPHAQELTGNDGIKCWAAADLEPLLQGGRP